MQINYLQDKYSYLYLSTNKNVVILFAYLRIGATKLHFWQIWVVDSHFKVKKMVQRQMLSFVNHIGLTKLQPKALKLSNFLVGLE